MQRKKRTPQINITPEVIKFREKRRWQIAFRRYVVEEHNSVRYAPYFGLDIKNIRNWFERQFTGNIGWEDFAGKWQFEHILPVTCFDFSIEAELKMCWNFTNIRVKILQHPKDTANQMDVWAAKTYFEKLYASTLYKPCKQLLQKITQLELSLDSEPQRSFITENRQYLDTIEHFSSLEFELLNSGRTIDEVIKEVNFLKKF